MTHERALTFSKKSTPHFFLGTRRPRNALPGIPGRDPVTVLDDFVSGTRPIVPVTPYRHRFSCGWAIMTGTGGSKRMWRWSVIDTHSVDVENISIVITNDFILKPMILIQNDKFFFSFNFRIHVIPLRLKKHKAVKRPKYSRHDYFYGVYCFS